jgi:hypothetical protein
MKSGIRIFFSRVYGKKAVVIETSIPRGIKKNKENRKAKLKSIKDSEGTKGIPRGE